jgi:hypothetical protein
MTAHSSSWASSKADAVELIAVLDRGARRVCVTAAMALARSQRLEDLDVAKARSNGSCSSQHLERWRASVADTAFPLRWSVAEPSAIFCRL